MPAVKLLLLILLSVHPLPALKCAVVLERAAATEPSKQLAVPKPIKSIVLAQGHEPLKRVVLFTNAIFAAVADIAITPVASGVGKLVVPPAPGAS